MSKLACALRALPLLGVLAALPVNAQTVPPAPANSERPTLAAPPSPNQIMANISAGATLAGGNTKSYSGTVGGRFQLVRRPHQLTLDVLATYAAARNTVDNEVHPTSQNIVGRARYDVFLSENNALFLAMAPRRDRFAGLDLRLQTQAGYLRNLYKSSNDHKLWLEVGYDGTYDNFTPWTAFGTPPPAEPIDLPKSEFIHSGRAYVGYTNLLTPLATLNTGVELLYDFKDSDNVRVNGTIELTSSLNARFKLSLLSRVLYDRVPVPGKEKTDYITTAQIVFTYDSVKPPEACPKCDCSDEVAAAKSQCKQDLSVSPADSNGAYLPPEEPATKVVSPPPSAP